jgi:hypothetical protein
MIRASTSGARRCGIDFVTGLVDLGDFPGNRPAASYNNTREVLLPLQIGVGGQAVSGDPDDCSPIDAERFE